MAKSSVTVYCDSPISTLHGADLTSPICEIGIDHSLIGVCVHLYMFTQPVADALRGVVAKGKGAAMKVLGGMRLLPHQLVRACWHMVL